MAPASMRRSTDHPDASPTSRHLASILENPLFKAIKTAERSTDIPSVHSTAAANATKLDQDPMDVFDRAVEQGMMTIQAATGCLLAKRRQLQLLEADETKATSSSDVGARVVSWLRTTSEEESLNFLHHRSFCAALLPFIVEEGMEQAVWAWLSKAMHNVSAGEVHTKLISDASYLLTQLVLIKRRPPHGDLDKAIGILLQAEQLFAGFPHVYKLLIQPWRSISWVSTVKSYNQTPASEVFYNAHLATAKRLPRPLLVERAHLHLFHPRQPNHKPAFEIFSNQRRLREIVDEAHSSPTSRSPIEFSDAVPWIAYLGYDTVNHLAKTGMTKEAKGVTELLRHEMADLLKRPMNAPDSLAI